MRNASQRGARRAGVLAIAVLGVLVVAVALVVAGCPDDTPGNGSSGGDTTAPTFTTAPTVDGDPTTTSATVKLTADEASKLFWVVYAGSDASPDTAATLIDAAKGSTVGAQRSGASQTVDAAIEKTVTITGLEAGTTYNFYAVLQDSAGNNGEVSAKLEITTATTGTTGIYTCENGTAKSGKPTGTSNIVSCASCESGFKLKGAANANGTTCVADSTAVYTCENGTPVDGTPSGSSDVVACQSCESGYSLKGSAGAVNTTCVEDTTTAQYTCANGTAKSGTPTSSSNIVSCESCESGYKLSGAANVDGTACVEDNTAPTFIEQPAIKAGSIGATSVTVTLTASELGKLVWVVYINGTQVADAAALINDASADPQPSTVVAKSAEAIVVDTSTDALEITVTGLTKNTPYDFYAVLQDAAQNMSALSTTLDIATATTAKYTCANGTAKGGAPSGDADVVACASCKSGFKLTGAANADTTACVATQYICENGMPQDGKPNTNADVAECKACNSGF